MSRVKLENTLKRINQSPKEPPKLNAFASVIPMSLLGTPTTMKTDMGNCSIVQPKKVLVYKPVRVTPEKQTNGGIACTPHTATTSEISFL
jgi:hypothetical protein